MRLYLFIGSLFLFACQSASGPCDYEIIKTETEVVGIQKYEQKSKSLYHVRLAFEGSSLFSSKQYLEKIKNIDIDSAFIARNNIFIGNRYSCTVSERLSGSCEEIIISFDHLFK